MRLYAPLIWTLSGVSLVASIFADEAYNIDYHQALIGIPQPENTFFHRPTASSNASLLYTISDKAVLGAVNPKDGSLVWRQPLAGRLPRPSWVRDKSKHPEETPLRASGETEAPPLGILVSDGGGSVVSYYGSTISSFSAANGKLIWQSVVPSGQLVRSAEVLPNLPDRQSSSSAADVVVLYEKGGPIVTKLSGDSGSVLWEHTDSSNTSPLFVASDGKQIIYASRQHSVTGSNSVKTTILALDDGRAMSSDSLKAEGILHTLSCPGSAYIFWYEGSSRTVKVGLLGSSKVRSFMLEKSSGEEIERGTIVSSCGLESSVHFLLHARTRSGAWAEIFHLPTPGAEISRTSVLPFVKGNDAFAVSTSGGRIFFTRITDEEIELYSASSHDVLGRWPRNKPSFGGPSHAQAEVVLRGESGYAVRTAEVSHGGEWTLMRSGETVWTRPEMLANVVAAAWADDLSDQALAHELGLEGHEDPFRAYVHRLKRHLGDLQSFPAWLRQLPSNIISGLLTSKNEAEKDLLGSKSLIVATSSGQYLALDPLRAGHIKWKVTTGIPSNKTHPVSLYIRDDIVTSYVSGLGVLKMNATDGSTISVDASDALFTRVAIAPGPVAPVAYKFLPDGEPEPISQDDNAPDGTYLVTWPSAGADVQGWMVGRSKSRLWTFSRGQGYHVVHVASRPRHDPVSSIGKVLADRSVLYKYLSENLVLVTSIKADSLAIDLVDSITGTVLYSTIHHNVSTQLPIPSILSENWFAYSFFSTASDDDDDNNNNNKIPPTAQSRSQSQSPQLVIAELYESSIANDRGPLGSSANYSSYTSANRPHVITQSFSLPQPITQLTTTQTLQGITSRHLLATLPTLDAILSIPRSGGVLDPRRPLDRDPTGEEAIQEGLTTRYHPVLDLHPALHHLSHARSVHGIRNIITTPTQLESTSLVFAFGHDVFGTRLSPSKGFDSLGQGFNKLALVGTVVGLAVLTAGLAPVVRRKGVERAWRM